MPMPPIMNSQPQQGVSAGGSIGGNIDDILDTI